MTFVDESGYPLGDPKHPDNATAWKDMADLFRPKPPRRVKATRAEWARIREEKLDACRVCGTASAALTLHHLVGRDLGGDDIADNLVALCGSGTTGCHGLVEHRDPASCRALRDSLTVAEVAYVLDRKGVDYLNRYYAR